MSEDLIHVSARSQRSISNNVEVCAPVNGDATIHQHYPTAKSDTFVHKRRIIPTVRSLQMKIRLLSGGTEKRDSSEKRRLLHSFLLQFICSVAHSLRSRRCFDVSITHTIERRAYRPTPWSWFRTVS
ncbi:hypothetical protein TNCV_1838171 [Trichonephila clavipes]|nr:hypothetical protein TNCV_1838171 [Trichonephila clavipes]